jgi:ribulose-phosphate 3-epimerase
MDGEFVPNTSLNFDFEIPTGFEYEAHLMIKNPLDWVSENSNKVDIVALHIETLTNIEETVTFIKTKGIKLTLALKAETTFEVVQPYLKRIDGILVMTSIPGSHCTGFLPGPLEKVKKLREIDDSIPIEVDGCENPENAKLARQAGANIFISGSYIFNSKNVGRAIREIEHAVV